MSIFIQFQRIAVQESAGLLSHEEGFIKNENGVLCWYCSRNINNTAHGHNDSSERDFASLNKCSECERSLHVGCVLFNNKIMHSICFRCSDCGNTLIRKSVDEYLGANEDFVRFDEANQKQYCAYCYTKTFYKPTCAECNIAIFTYCNSRTSATFSGQLWREEVMKPVK